jgi:F-box interacting protein
MASGSYSDDDVVSASQSLTEETTPATGTLESPLPTLPFDLIAEILCRLPVMLLLQLRLLCKSFNFLISDPKFAKKNLHLSIKCHHLMVSTKNDSHETLLFDSPIPSILATSRVTLNQLGQPIRKYLSFVSCDGILCFTIDHRFALLWNPSLGKFKSLPKFRSSLKRNRAIRSIFSFGYDRFIDNYKVFVISFYKGNRNKVHVHVLGTNSWRRVQDFPYPRTIYGHGVFASGSINWLAYDTDSYSRVIVSFDLEKESYQKFFHPGFARKDLWLGVVRDCLCVFAHTKMYLYVWIMKEHGNNDSWVKLYTVPLMVEQVLHVCSRALYIFKDDQLLMNFHELESKKNKFVIYDLKNGTLNIHEIQNMNHLWCTEVYIESLISPC